MGKKENSTKMIERWKQDKNQIRVIKKAEDKKDKKDD